MSHVEDSSGRGLIEAAKKVVTDPHEWSRHAEHYSSEALKASPGKHAYQAHRSAAIAHDQAHTMYGNKAGHPDYPDAGKKMDHHRKRAAYHADEARKHEFS